MIAEEVCVQELGEESWEKRALYKLGVFSLECDAEKRCEELNRKEMENDPDLTEGPYFVISLELK